MQLDLFLEMDDLTLQAKLLMEMWDSLDDDEQAAVVAVLARLMARAVAPEEEEADE